MKCDSGPHRSQSSTAQRNEWNKNETDTGIRWLVARPAFGLGHVAIELIFKLSVFIRQFQPFRFPTSEIIVWYRRATSSFGAKTANFGVWNMWIGHVNRVDTLNLYGSF